jgi:hypothetical protein
MVSPHQVAEEQQVPGENLLFYGLNGTFRSKEEIVSAIRLESAVRRRLTGSYQDGSEFAANRICAGSV